jgi:SAM-dependent methyltransferase
MVERRLVFGGVARAYDEARPGYPAAVADAVLDYAGHGGAAGPLVEVGAGTGKATALFAGHRAALTCVEPDPRMATVLRERFPGVTVAGCGFEEWTPPPGGVALVYSAQAWHWVDPARRWRLAYEALAPGGALALFGHGYDVADAALAAALDAVYARVAPQALDRSAPAAQPWMVVEMRDCGLFTDVRLLRFDAVVGFPADRYLALLDTFSAQRLLPEAVRVRLFDALGEVLDAHGGSVPVRLDTALALGRR